MAENRLLLNSERRAQILDAAGERFYRAGYHQVNMSDIAAAAGVGISALYRRFASKQELLLALLDQHLTAVEQLVVTTTDLLEDCIRYHLAHRDFGLLWERESGHLPAEQRRELRQRMRALAAALHPAIPRDDARDLRAWALFSVLDSPSHHRTQLRTDLFVQALREAATAVITAELTPDQQLAPQLVDKLRPASRREHLLIIATRLFAERGYHSVGLDDIGTAAGIAGPSVYNHFPSKADVLAAALDRGNAVLWLGLAGCLNTATDPANALRALSRHYTDFTITHPDIVKIIISETIYLPDPAAVRRTQHDYVAEWVALLIQTRPDLTSEQAHVRVYAALSLINSVARIPHLRSRPGHAAHTAELAHHVLID